MTVMFEGYGYMVYEQTINTYYEYVRVT